jgi:hypothetical protein
MILDFTPFNILAVLASGIASLIIGFVWYGPLFGKPWAEYTGWTEEKIKTMPSSRMGLTYGLTFICALITAAVLSGVSNAMSLTGVVPGLLLGLVTSIGFAAMAFATTHLFEHKPLGLWLIVSGYQVIYMAAAGIIVTVWR